MLLRRTVPCAVANIMWRPPHSFSSSGNGRTVEIVSPSDRLRQVRAKCLDYLDAGVRLVWLVEPKPQRVTVYLPDRSTHVLGIQDTLHGGDVLPGFTLPLAEVFD